MNRRSLGNGQWSGCTLQVPMWVQARTRKFPPRRPRHRRSRRRLSRPQMERKLCSKRRKTFPMKLLLRQLRRKSEWLRRLLLKLRSLILSTPRNRRNLMLKEARAWSRAPPFEYKRESRRQLKDLGRNKSLTCTNVSIQWSSLRGTWIKSEISLQHHNIIVDVVQAAIPTGAGQCA